MPVNIVLPALSAGMEDAIVARWLKAEGDAVEIGEPIAEIETDKATMELEAEAAGTIGRLLVAEGKRADVNQTIAVLLAAGEDAGSLPQAQSAPAKPATPAVDATPSAPQAASQSAAPAPQPVATAVSEGARHKASPLARRLAAERGVSLEGLAGSGPKGRIVRIDIERAAVSAAEPEAIAAETAETPAPAAIPPGIGPYESVPHSTMRRTIARRLLEAKTTVPHFYLEMSCNLDALLALRQQINEGREKAERISVNDFVIKASAVALAAVPDANVIWTEEAMLRLADIDIAVAVATDNGLITPVIRRAGEKSLGTISAEMKALAAKARDGKLRPEEYQGGGFSISNLGMYGVSSFAAIINPPQSAILAVGAAERRPVERDDGTLAFATMMTCTLSVDHRSVDGALGARLLGALKAALEDPLRLLV
ncbi:pyruvate dehydrogenase complex dihydrolipoamide acetyltransferase [uncultured Martelella sp.]|uniref:pyruvate dehydrogenase complex dihydrolipoamide acetyltransferase n=1 Tax=uncultured Martelella sp. TaxID=392331 RepID=UPI0029C7C20F|nr:pyruvate dehydrogenase complex dihydrolipoamide acetyltransferase [uncultured Martelella sp.]